MTGFGHSYLIASTKKKPAPTVSVRKVCAHGTTEIQSDGPSEYVFCVDCSSIIEYRPGTPQSGVDQRSA